MSSEEKPPSPSSSSGGIKDSNTLPRVVMNANVKHGKFSTLLGLGIFSVLSVASLHVALRNQHYNEKSVLQRHIQRVRNFVNHGEFMSDDHISPQHKEHDKCTNGKLPYPIQD